MEKDYYQTLNVPPDASRQQIKKAYVKLVKQFHPDRNPKDPVSAERTKLINEAYAVLKDRQQRLKYDSMRARGGMPDSAVSYDHDAGEHPFFHHMHIMMQYKKNPQALKNLALHAFHRGQYAYARSLLERGIMLNSDDHEFYMGLSWCLFHQGHYKRCARVLEKLLVLNPKELDAWINLAWLQEAEGDLSGAVKTLQTAQSHFPNQPKLKSRISEIERKMG